MTFQDDLAILIADLEEILSDSQSSGDPRVLPLLERVWCYLLTHQFYRKLENYQKRSERLTENILTILETQIISRVQSLDNDLENLHNKRQSLLQEIRQLEHERQQMMSEFLKKLTIGCTQVVKEKFSRFKKNDRFAESSLNNLSVTPEISSERLARYLDLALEKILDSLGQDIQNYSDCLAQGLEGIYSLGEKGEAKFLAYFNRLQQQLEARVDKLTLASSPSEEPIRVKSTREKWFLGIDITSEQLTAVLLGFNTEIYPNLGIPVLEETVNLSSVQSSNVTNPLASWKPALRTLKTQLMAQATFLRLGEIEYSVTQIMSKLRGIIVVCPSQWNLNDRAQLQSLLLDTYSLSSTEQIIWVPKASAVALSYFSQAKTVQNTLVIDVGETTTELALVNVKNPFSSLISRQLAYGFQSIDQDILCQLIYPQWQPQVTKILPNIQSYFPQVGSSNLSLRGVFSQQLNNHPLGKTFLEAAQLTRFILKKQDSFISSLEKQSWGVTRQEFIEQIITPWINKLNQTLNSLFSLGETSQYGIGQIILLGKEIETVDYILLTWLQKKFFQATIILQSKNKLENKLTQGLVHIPNLILMNNIQ